MKLLKRILIGVVAVLVLVGAGGYGTYWYKNRIPPQLVEPNYYSYYKTQDTQPVGKIAIFVSGLFMPENFRIDRKSVV